MRYRLALLLYRLADWCNPAVEEDWLGYVEPFWTADDEHEFRAFVEETSG